jgi:hypothetical protein
VSLLNVVVGAQIASMLALGFLWLRDGNWRLAATQGCYCVATAALFAKA